MHKKWTTLINQDKAILQKIKNSNGVREYFSNEPAEGYMLDNISKNTVLISNCKSSTLRRYEKLLNKYYNLVNTPTERKKISMKLSEIQAELLKRPDDSV